jgi:hypothetical protein
MPSSGNSGPSIKRLKQFKQTLLTFGSNRPKILPPESEEGRLMHLR